MKSICDVSNSAYQLQLQVRVRVAFAWKSACGVSSVKKPLAKNSGKFCCHLVIKKLNP